MNGESDGRTAPPWENPGDYLKHVFGQLAGMMTCAMIYLGYHLGLYRALAETGPATSAELAAATNLNERWVREWLRQQAAARIIEYAGSERFALPPVAALVMATDAAPVYAAGAFSALPAQASVLPKLLDCFRTGIGLPYDALGAEGACGVEAMLAPWFRTMLVPVALPQLDGVVAKLEAGARVADVGCGTGIALVEMAKVYPRSSFLGFDVSRHALLLAERNRRAAGVDNVAFHDATFHPLPEDGSFDLVTTFDCVHDMTHPQEVMGAIRRTLKDDGTWLIADVNARPSFEENVADNPMAAMMYGFSVLVCLSSSLSVPQGAGLGTLGFHEQVARDMTAAAGFTRFRRHDFQNPVNAYYEVRP